MGVLVGHITSNEPTFLPPRGSKEALQLRFVGGLMDGWTYFGIEQAALTMELSRGVQRR